MSQQDSQEKREKWGSKLGFIMAAAGSAIGLGNIWKFPYLTGQYGGGAFVLVYLLFLFVVAVPVLLAEMSLGRYTEKNPIGAYSMVKPKTGWKYVGGMGIVAGFILLSFYSVITGWTFAYVFKSITGQLSITTTENLPQIFTGFISGLYQPVLWHALVMVLTVGIVVSGVKNGIEKWSKILMPILFLLVILLVLRSVSLEGALKGIEFYLKPDFSKLNNESLIAALGQAFFTLSLGMGTMLTYGSYLSKEDNMPSAAASVGLMDTFIALLAGLAIFPAVFALGFEPDAGPGLVFIILPAVFNQMPVGQIFGSLFFILLAIAALTSAISMLEVVVAYFVDELKWSRKKASILAGIVVFFLGIPSSLANGLWADYKLFGLNFLDLMNYITSNLMLPLGGMLIAIFVAYVWGSKEAVKEVTNQGSIEFSLAPAWTFLVKFVAPVAIAIVLIHGLGIFG